MITFKQEIQGKFEVLRLEIWDGEEGLGFYLLVPHGIDIYEVHTHFLPKAYGSAKRITSMAMEEAFKQLPQMQTLLTKVPVSNLLAKKLAEYVGMKMYGTIPKSFKNKDEVYEDQDVLYISRESVKCQ